jgi:hypothetical protein
MTSLSLNSGRKAAWRLVKVATALATLPVVLWACNSHPLESPDPLPDQQTDDFFAINPVRDVDLLFVIDNSGSTDNKQANFIRNFPAFITALNDIQGGLPNVRIAVVSSDLGSGGVMTSNMCNGHGQGAAFITTSVGGMPCGITTAEQWITPNNVPPGQIAAVFQCMANRGSQGCGYEHQLQAANQALHPRPDWNPMNEGFLRPDAYLAIIFLTDEDDCSGPDNAADFFGGASPAGFIDNSRCAAAGHICNNVPVMPATLGMPFDQPLTVCAANPMPTGLFPVQQIVNDVLALKPGHPEKFIVAAIAGWPPPGQEANARYRLTGTPSAIAQVCTQAGGGTPALRIKAFLDSFKNNTLQTVCQDNFAGALTTIGTLVGTVVGNPCLSAPLVDTDMAAAGLQADCVVEDKLGDMRTALPSCARAGAARPCWSVSPAPNCMGSGYQIAIDRGGQNPPQGLEQVIKCRTCAKPNDPRCRRM